ncbi:hypothetical protein QFC22_000468 [Naganishia vaughanmartiniae]|uniref:Uncharacterized protein n=1 Tax=Naganishia vaughanmartiniae TaxID=1424756 RepID=A0ACC2XS24_9TREE|nr:hypothetical protein QFC22_000468 [Naganishia vaughanmartiniae]
MTDVQPHSIAQDASLGQSLPDVDEQKPDVSADAQESSSTTKENVNTIPENASETLYLQNLNETVRLDFLKQTLLNLFKPYGVISPVIAHDNLRMRGQAFVSFPDKETADKARKEVAGFPLYGKPMQLSFAKTRSDVVVKHEEGEEGLASHKKRRLEHKKESRKNNPLRQKAQAKLKATAAADPTGVQAAAAPRRAQIQMPDEYLPPNSLLFLQNLPEGTTKEDLHDVFNQHPNLLEVRLIPAKKDIAFVEYADEESATVAKEALHNFKIDGETKMKATLFVTQVSYAKR